MTTGPGDALERSVQRNSEARLEINLFGTFKVTSADGVDLTPGSLKAQALIALIATNKEFRRSRAWLQDKLWSTRGPQQASGSLRQALVEVRQALGSHSKAIEANRTSVCLDSALVHVKSSDGLPSADSEFLQGMDVKDTEFEDWLRDMRSYYSTPSARSQSHVNVQSPDLVQSRSRLTIVMEFSRQNNSDHALFEAAFFGLLHRSLQEHLDIDVVRGMPQAAGIASLPAGALLLKTQMMGAAGGGIRIRATLEEFVTLRCFWVDETTSPVIPQDIEENVACLGLIYRLVFAVADLVASQKLNLQNASAPEAVLLSSAAFRKMFTMRHEELHAADALLKQAIDVSPRGLYFAWRAQLATIRLIERQTDSTYELQQQSDRDTAMALEREPLNSNVLASVANARLVFDGDCDSSLVLARQGVLANRANPLAWWSWANATLYSGQPNLAYAAAITAGNLAEKSSLKFWADFQRQLTAAVNGHYEEATRFGTSAHALAPNFRPALRYLFALHARAGSAEATARTLRKLIALEQDFSIERLVSDPAYPVSMMRRAGLISPGSFERLGPVT